MFIPTVYAYWTDKVESKVNITITQGLLDVLDVSDPDPEPVPVPEGDLQNEGGEDVIQSSGSDSGKRTSWALKNLMMVNQKVILKILILKVMRRSMEKENNTREQR